MKQLPTARRTQAAPPFRTNPSAIARYFFHDCERFLYYTAADPALRKSHGIPKPEFDHSPLVEAILASGSRWEEEVVTRLLKGRVVVAPGSGELHTRRLSPAQTIRCLRHKAGGRPMPWRRRGWAGRFARHARLMPRKRSHGKGGGERWSCQARPCQTDGSRAVWTTAITTTRSSFTR